MRKEICDKLCQDNSTPKNERFCVCWYKGNKINNKVCSWAVEVEEFIKENMLLNKRETNYKCNCSKENANSGYPLLADGWRDVRQTLPEVIHLQVDGILFYYNARIWHGSYHNNGYFYSCEKIGAVFKKDVIAWKYLSELNNPEV